VQSFARLKAIDLAEIVGFSDSDDLQITFEDQFQRQFNTAADLPLWRVVVLKNNIICFAWHHCIGDGLSGTAFHRALLASLQEAIVTDDGTVVHLPTTTTPLIPALDTIINISPSWRTFLRATYDLFAPTSWTRGGSAWTGNTVTVDATLKTHVRLIDFPPQDVTTFLTLCRSNNASLTGAIHTLAVSALSRVILSRQNIKQTTISCYIPISLRGVAGIPQGVFCDCVSTLNFYPSFQPDFSWAEAAKFTAILRSCPKSGEEVGMLKYLFGNYVGYFQGQLGHKRQGGLELSNVGLFGGVSLRGGEWSIGKMAFAQCNSVVGPALKINVIGSPAGGLAITVTWGENSVEERVAESFVSGLEHGFMELLMWCVPPNKMWLGIGLFTAFFVDDTMCCTCLSNVVKEYASLIMSLDLVFDLSMQCQFNDVKMALWSF
jgi:hypothetical protein